MSTDTPEGFPFQQKAQVFSYASGKGLNPHWLLPLFAQWFLVGAPLAYLLSPVQNGWFRWVFAALGLGVMYALGRRQVRTLPTAVEIEGDQVSLFHFWRYEQLRLSDIFYLDTHARTPLSMHRSVAVGYTRNGNPRVFFILRIPGHHGLLSALRRTPAPSVTAASSRYNIPPRALWGVLMFYMLPPIATAFLTSAYGRSIGVPAEAQAIGAVFFVLWAANAAVCAWLSPLEVEMRQDEAEFRFLHEGVVTLRRGEVDSVVPQTRGMLVLTPGIGRGFVLTPSSGHKLFVLPYFKDLPELVRRLERLTWTEEE